MSHWGLAVTSTSMGLSSQHQYTGRAIIPESPPVASPLKQAMAEVLAPAWSPLQAPPVCQAGCKQRTHGPSAPGSPGHCPQEAADRAEASLGKKCVSLETLLASVLSR